MTKMFDRFIANGNSGFNFKHSNSTIDDVMVFDIQNIASYHKSTWHEKSGAQKKSDIVNIAPPYPAFWMEFSIPSENTFYMRSLRSNISTVGVMVVGHDIEGMAEIANGSFSQERSNYEQRIRNHFISYCNGEKEPIRRNGKLFPVPPLSSEKEEREGQVWAYMTGLLNECPVVEKGKFTAIMTAYIASILYQYFPVKWLLEATVFLEGVAGGISNPISTSLFPLNKDGTILDVGMGDDVFPVHFHQSFLELFGKETQDGEEILGQWIVSEALRPLLLAITFLHCKNVDIAATEPSPKLSHAYVRRHGRPLIRFHTIQIGPVRKILETEGEIESRGLKLALHICRGHFKDFREQGLFGRNKGVYWWENHVRGTAAEGIVDKEYRVMAPKSTDLGDE